VSRRAPTHKRVAPGAAAEHHTERGPLETAVKGLCVRLLARSGLSWADWEDRTRRRAKHLWERGRLQEGVGRRLDRRALLAWELDRKLWFGVRTDRGEQSRPRGPSPAELACIWLLLEGIGHLPAKRIKDGMSARTVVDSETETMKKHVARHGQKAPWLPVSKSDDAEIVVDVVAVRDKDGKLLRHEHRRGKVGSDPDPKTIKDANALPLRIGMRRSKVGRRGLKPR
jgi:hypothetical protein